MYIWRRKKQSINNCVLSFYYGEGMVVALEISCLFTCVLYYTLRLPTQEISMALHYPRSKADTLLRSLCDLAPNTLLVLSHNSCYTAHQQGTACCQKYLSASQHSATQSHAHLKLELCQATLRFPKEPHRFTLASAIFSHLYQAQKPDQKANSGVHAKRL